tara:strand:+ start:261 stop:1634 length:1374 start_codon:yes stop_codon:yes gene_type:complete
MAGAKLTKTFSSAGNTKTGTQSFWIKRSKISTNMMAGMVSTGGGSYYGMQFLTSDQIDFYLYYNTSASAWQGRLKTNRKFRDTNGWYHFVIAWDTTQGTNTNRLKMYVNGVQETSFEIATYPNQDQTFLYNAAQAHAINGEGGGFFDGEMAHYHWVDGTAYTPTTFGETDATTGIWKPKASPSGISYGTNGFFLKFENAANMGLDSSGQSNNWTTSGTIIKNIDTPDNVFCTLNPLDCDLVSGLSNANTTFSGFNTGTDYSATSSTLSASSGKFYWEAKVTDLAEIDQVGVRLQNGVSMSIQGSNGSAGLQGTAYGGKGVQFSNGNKAGDGSQSAYMGGFSANDIIMVALDLDNNKITFGRNGQWSDGSGNANQTYANSTAAFTNLTSGEFYCPAQTSRSYGSNSGTTHYNFGNGYFGTTAVSSAQNPDDGIGIFEYDPPSGFRALCTKSINAEEYS